MGVEAKPFGASTSKEFDAAYEWVSAIQSRQGADEGRGHGSASGAPRERLGLDRSPGKISRGQDGEKWEAVPNEKEWQAKAYVFGELSGGGSAKRAASPATRRAYRACSCRGMGRCGPTGRTTDEGTRRETDSALSSLPSYPKRRMGRTSADSFCLLVRGRLGGETKMRQRNPARLDLANRVDRAAERERFQQLRQPRRRPADADVGAPAGQARER